METYTHGAKLYILHSHNTVIYQLPHTPRPSIRIYPHLLPKPALLPCRRCETFDLLVLVAYGVHLPGRSSWAQNGAQNGPTGAARAEGGRVHANDTAKQAKDKAANDSASNAEEHTTDRAGDQTGHERSDSQTRAS